MTETLPTTSAINDPARAEARKGGLVQLNEAVRVGWLHTPGNDPLVPSWVQERLRAKSPRLGMTWHRALNAFVLVLEWPEGDPRWADYQAQRTAYPYEILPGGIMPKQMGPDQALAWAEAKLRIAARSRDDLRRMIEEEQRALERHNAENEAALRESAVDVLEEGWTRANAPAADRIGMRRERVESGSADALTPAQLDDDVRALLDAAVPQAEAALGAALDAAVATVAEVIVAQAAVAGDADGDGTPNTPADAIVAAGELLAARAEELAALAPTIEAVAEQQPSLDAVDAVDAAAEPAVVVTTTASETSEAPETPEVPEPEPAKAPARKRAKKAEG